MENDVQQSVKNFVALIYFGMILMKFFLDQIDDRYDFKTSCFYGAD